jgi:hypothetical protein
MASPRPSSKPVLALAAASLLSLASSAQATVVCNAGSPTLPFTVPATLDGVYANVVTGALQTVGPFTAGWDINAYATGGNLNFFFTTQGGQAMTDGTAYLALSAGAVIGPAGTYSTATGTATSMANWRATQTGKYVGLKFINEGAGGATNYGWIQLDTTGATGFPASIKGFCYQNDGTQILAGGTVPVELQSFSVE